MWTKSIFRGDAHGALLRFNLALCGWLSLSGVQSRRPPLLIWVLRLVPAAAYLLVGIGIITFLVRGPESYMKILVGFAVYGNVINTALIFLIMTLRRGRLTELEDELVLLGQLVPCNCLFYRATLILRVVFFWMMAAALVGLWFAFTIVVADDHSTYLIVMDFDNFAFPASFLTEEGYWYCMALQGFLVVVICTMQVTFDVCYFIWMNAICCHLEGVRLRVAEVAPVDAVPDAASYQEPPNSRSLESLSLKQSHVQGMVDGVVRGMGSIRGPNMLPPRMAFVSPSSEQPSVGGPGVTVAVTRLRVHPPKPTLGGTADFQSDPASALAAADHHYTQLSRFSSNVSSFCSLPLMGGHFAIVCTMLTGSYFLLWMLSLPSYDGKTVQLTAYTFYLLLNFVRLVVCSSDGDSIIEKKSQLLDTIANMNWIDLPQEAKLKRQALIEKIKRPISVDINGYFEVRKGNVLPIVSFILTYLVIMIQMLPKPRSKKNTSQPDLS